MLYSTKQDMFLTNRIRYQIGGIKLFDYQSRKFSKPNSN